VVKLRYRLMRLLAVKPVWLEAGKVQLRLVGNLFWNNKCRRSNEMRIVIITIAVVFTMGVANVQAEIVWDSGHHVYSEGEDVMLQSELDIS